MADHLVSGPMSQSFWDQRYRQQAGWTAGMRAYALQKAGLEQARRVLEVGCGTGVICAELSRQTQAALWGVDIQAEGLDWMKERQAQPDLVQGDGHQLPFQRHFFDITCCHFLLLWVENPGQVLAEMRRVTRPGGWVLALAEPDYGGRIDYPEELAQIGLWQEQALRRQGAEPRLGRRLAALFQQAGLQAVETGLMGGQWHSQKRDVSDGELEWQTLENDLANLAEPVPPAQIERLRATERAARQRGERILFVPTFYALGQAPD